MAVGPIKDSHINEDRARQFVAQYRISDIKQTIKARHEYADYFNTYMTDPYRFEPTIQYTHVKMLSMEMEEASFARIVDKMTELEELESDPETAKLLHEAKFIHRLKRGHF
jgi:flagellar motor switch protein FliM